MEFIKTINPIEICDIGASPIDKTKFIDNLMDNTNSYLYGFEPNKDEFIKLKNEKNKKYFNFAIGDGEEKILNICQSAGMSSFLKPDLEYLKLFHWFEEASKILSQQSVKTKKLDDIEFKNNIDFFKIDVQGYESEIIKFGNNKIKNSLVIQLETSPIPLYENEKSFSFICNQLENLGFNLHMFNNIDTRCFKPTLIDNNPRKGINHLFQLDCVFIKNFSEINKLSEEQLKKIILILFHSFKSYDIVDLLIAKLDKKTNKNYTNLFRNFMKNQKIDIPY